MGDINKFCERMRYWCEEANLGYDQGNRFDIRYGGECDCSWLTVFALYEAGFETGSASFTGNMKENLVKHGWVVVPNNGHPQKGDILLKERGHAAVWLGDCLAEAIGDENGNIRGGASGDQTGNETRTCPYYNFPWDFYLRWPQANPVVVQDEKSMVKVAQRWLMDMGYNVGSYGIDGVCGNDTKQAMTRCLQKTLNIYGAGLDVDGIYGELTATALDKYGPVEIGCSRKALVQILQVALLAAGYSVGDYSIDGVCGNDTANAIREFQKDNGLVVDGKAGYNTGYKLFV